MGKYGPDVCLKFRPIRVHPTSQHGREGWYPRAMFEVVVFAGEDKDHYQNVGTLRITINEYMVLRTILMIGVGVAKGVGEPTVEFDDQPVMEWLGKQLHNSMWEHGVTEPISFLDLDSGAKIPPVQENSGDPDGLGWIEQIVKGK